MYDLSRTSKQFTSHYSALRTILAALLVLAAVPGMATTYYVSTSGNDNNNGLSSGAAWATINRGDVLGVLNAGDVVQVSAGTYAQSSADGVVISNRAGTPGSPITYQAVGSVVIDQSSYTATTSYGFKISKVGIKVQGFDIRGAVHCVFIADGSNYCTIYNNLIHDGRVTSVDASGVYVCTADNVSINNNRIYNFYYGGSTPWSPASAGIRTTGSTNLKVYNNTLDYCYLGVFYYPGTGGFGTMTAKNNVVVNCPGWAFVNPWSTDPSLITASNNLISGNGTNYGNFPAGNNSPCSGDVTSAPVFVNGASHDYRLQISSPAVNAGVNVGLAYNGSAPDMGAFESTSGASSTYYVSTSGNDNNDGLTSSTAWASINKGDALKILFPGNTVSVAAGTYSTQGANGAYIQYCPSVAYVANGAAVIDQSSYSTGNSYGFILATTGITVQGFEIKNAVHGVLVLDGANSCVVAYNTIHDGRVTSVDASGVYVCTADNVQVSSNLIYNFYYNGSTPWSPASAGIRTTGSTNLKVYNNTIDYCYLGLFYYSGTGGYGTLTVKNNIIENCPGWALVNPWCVDLTKWTLSNNMLYANGIDYGNVPTGTSNLFGYDPRHVNRASHNYALAANSAAVNGGVYVGIPYSGPCPDIGACESGYTQNDEASARHFVMDYLAGSASQSRPFTFYYNNQWFYSVQANWTFSSSVTTLDSNRTQRTLTYTDPSTGLQAQCVATEYLDYPAVDWVVNFTNTSGSNTPMLTSVESMHTVLYDSSASGDYTVYHAQGCNASITDFQPFTAGMYIGAQVNLKSTNGKSSEGILPFFNIMRPDGNGVAAAIGWTGQWQASFTRSDQNNLILDAGMIINESLWNWTNTYLLPGEQIRTPSQLLVWWSGGDKVYGHNKLRSLILAHYSGVTNPPVCTAWPGDFNGRTAATEIQCMDHLADGRHAPVPVQNYVIDTGWFHYLPAPNNIWEWSTGNWDYCDTTKFPPETVPPYRTGLRLVSDHARNIGYNFGLWVEPERCMPGTDTYLTLSSIPPYTANALLAPTNAPNNGVDYTYTRLVNLGDSQALAWIEGKINSVIGDHGVNLYRQDMNARPIYYWVDDANRAGIKQIKYITGLYAFLDYLKAQNPSLIIDNCAGGGKRIDIEMLKRSFMLTRADGADIWNPIETQSETFGLAQWIPITGIGGDTSTYNNRSGWGSHFYIPIDWGAIAYNDASWTQTSAIMTQLDTYKQLFRGDFYPLTAYSTADNVWIAWQCDRPDLGLGLVQAFRRPSNGTGSQTYPLKGLDSGATYRITNPDAGGYVDYSGSYLMSTGLQFTLGQSCAGVLKYQKL